MMLISTIMLIDVNRNSMQSLRTVLIIPIDSDDARDGDNDDCSNNAASNNLHN